MPNTETSAAPRNTEEQLVGRIACEWRVHTYRLLKEIADNSGQPILQKPMAIFGKLLADVGERAAELNDPRLNALMLRLTIYTAADPESPDYDPDLCAQVMREANAALTGGEAVPSNGVVGTMKGD
jgi:hypothetical protein